MQKRMVTIVVLAAVWVALLAGSSMAVTKTASIIRSDYGYCTLLYSTTDWDSLSTGRIWYGGYGDNSNAHTFLKFNLTDPTFVLPADANFTPPANQVLVVESASLELHAYGNHAPIEWEYDGVYACTNDSWTKATLVWSTQPAIGPQIALAGPYPVPYGTEGGSGNPNYAKLVTAESSDLATFVQQQANGDKVLTLALLAPDTVTAGYHEYMRAGPTSPGWAAALNVTYHFDYLTGDFNHNGVVNFQDLAIMVQDWLKCVDPEIASCQKPWL